MSDLGARPVLQWIDKKLLSIDPAYQRTIQTRRSQNLIEKIAKEFVWAGCSTIVVAPSSKPGRYVILDGQHRHAAAMMRGDIHDLPCLLVDARKVQDQARIFISLNRDRIAIPPLSIFWSGFHAGEPEPRGIIAACREAGVEILRTPKVKFQLKPNQTVALGALRKLYRGELGAQPGARTMVAQILKVLRDAYPTTNGQLGSRMIESTARVLANQVKRSLMIKVLQGTNSAELEIAAARMREKDETVTIRQAHYKSLWALTLKAHAKETGQRMQELAAE